MARPAKGAQIARLKGQVWVGSDLMDMIAVRLPWPGYIGLAYDTAKAVTSANSYAQSLPYG